MALLQKHENWIFIITLWPATHGIPTREPARGELEAARGVGTGSKHSLECRSPRGAGAMSVLDGKRCALHTLPGY